MEIKKITFSSKQQVAANQNVKERLFWQQQLASPGTDGDLPATALLPDFPDSTAESLDRDTVTINFNRGGDIFDRLLRLCGESDPTLHVALTTVLALLLFRFSGREDIFLAVPVYKQEQAEQAEMINSFLPIRLRVSADMSFKGLLINVKTTLSDAVRHQNFPIEVLLAQWPAVHSLLTAGILLDNVHERECLDRLSLPLLFLFSRNPGHITLVIEFETHRYRRESMNRLAAHYADLLRNSLLNINQSLGNLECMTAEEKEQVLNRFNAQHGDEPTAKSLHELFEDQVRKTPDHVVLTCNVDFNDFYRELEDVPYPASEIPVATATREKLKGCLFKKNPFIFQFEDSSFLESITGEAGLKLLLTHNRNFLLVNNHLLHILDNLDDGGNLYSYWEELAGKNYRLFFGEIVKEKDSRRPSPGRVTDFVAVSGKMDEYLYLIKRMAAAHLIILVDYKPNDPPTAPSIMFPTCDSITPEMKAVEPKRNRPGEKPSILLLGDSTGAAGVASTGIIYLASYLRRNGCDAYCRWYDTDDTEASLEAGLYALLSDLKPQLVGISMKWFPHMARVLEMCRLVKIFDPAIRIVLGGNTAAYFWKEVMACRDIDAVVLGDGEVPLLELCRGKDPSTIPNCVYRRDGGIKKNDITYVQDNSNSDDIFLSHLDEIFVDPLESYLAADLYIPLGKGCARQCFYCAGCRDIQIGTFNRARPFLRRPDQVRRDLEAARKVCGAIMFDSEVPIPDFTGYFHSLFENIDLSDHFCTVYLWKLPPGDFVQLISRTFKYVTLNVDVCCLSERHRLKLADLKLVKPQFSDWELFDFLDTCENYGNIEVKISQIAGLPYGSDRDLQEGDELLGQIMKKYTCFGGLEWGRLHAQPGAPLIRDPGAHHLVPAAASFSEFLEYSRENLAREIYPGLEDMHYPLLYLTDDAMNSRLSKHYQLTNRRVEKFLKERCRRLEVTRNLTYRQLNDMSNRLGRYLRRIGAGPDNLVALLMDSSILMAVALLGVLKAGAAYLPLSPDLPQRRIEQILKDCVVGILVTIRPMEDNFDLGILRNFSLGDQDIIHTAPRPAIREFDTLPIPDRSFVDYEKYNRYLGLQMFTNSIALQTSRGCPFNCAYCHKIWPKTHVFRSAENIFEEIELYYRMGIRNFSFIDDIFNFNVPNSERFFRMILRKRMKINLIFSNGLRGDLLSHDYIDLMVEAGAINFSLALETASPRLQKLIGKRLNLKKLQDNLSYICRRHPRVILDLFTMIGFPTETEEEALSTLAFIKKQHWLHFPYVNILRIYPNTDMEKIALRHGISKRAIDSSVNLPFHALPHTLPFSKEFAVRFQSRYLNEYFLDRDRLLHVLPYQMKVLTEEEMVKKYNSYLPVDILSFEELLRFLDIQQDELGQQGWNKTEPADIPDLNRKITAHFPCIKPRQEAIRVMLLDLSQYFSSRHDYLSEHVEAPLGLMYLMTYLKRELKDRVAGKIAKSGVDFDSFEELRKMIGDFKPHLIGLRTLSLYKDFFHQTTQKIREWYANIPQISGGPYATSSYRTVLSDPAIDLVVLGEGEITLKELVTRMIEQNNKLPPEEVLGQISGIAFVPGHVKQYRSSLQNIVCIDTQDSPWRKEKTADLEKINHPGDLAYTIFTSGSTGIPKGVGVSHLSVVNTLRCRREEYRFDESTVALQLFSYGFDGFVTSFFTPIISGGRVVLLNSKEMSDINEITRVIIRNRVNHFICVPPLFRLIVKSLSTADAESLRVVTLAGDVLTADLLDISRKKNRRLELANEYGVTEAAVMSTIHRHQERETEIRIGRPAWNTQLYILDPRGKPMPVGIAGELCIAGTGLSRGYLNNPLLTAEKFVVQSRSFPLPGGEKDNGSVRVLYRTGDLARWAADGTVEFLGRIDTQVKLRGFRIEPAEIEARLSRIPDINEACVLRIKDNGDNYLCAYYTSVSDIKAQEIKESLSQQLPGYMVPTAFVRLDKIPRTLSGKIDRKELPAPSDSSGSVVVPPRNQLERELLELWADILGKKSESIGINGNFFDLGGHSLKAISLAARIKEKFGIDLVVADIFDLQTVARLADFIRNDIGSPTGMEVSAGEIPESERTVIPKSIEKSFYNCSSAQKRMYVLQQLHPGSTNYNMTQVVPLGANSDRQRLEATFEDLIKRHEGLRTSFVLKDGDPVQKIHDSPPFHLELHRLDDHGSVDEEISILRQVVGDFIRSFELSVPPLFRVVLVEFTEGNSYLVVDIHHIICDGLSMNILVRDFISLHRGEELPVLARQYRDYAEWQHSSSRREAIRKQEAYWLEMYADGVPELSLPADFERPPIQNFEGSIFSFHLGNADLRFLRQLARKCEVTMFMVLLSVFYVLLHKITDQEDIVVGIPVSGRNHPALDNIVGMFVNSLALRNRLVPGITFVEFLRNIKASTLAAYHNQDYQFEDLVGRVAQKRDTGYNPLFNTSFTLQTQVDMGEPADNGGADETRLPDRPENHEMGIGKSRIDMLWIGMEMSDTLLFSIEYSSSLFEKKTIKRFSLYFQEIIAAVREDSNIPLNAILFSHDLVEADTKIQEADFAF